MLTTHTQLEGYTTPCPNKATNSLVLDSHSNTNYRDATCIPNIQSTTHKKTKSELINSDTSDQVLSPTQVNLAANHLPAQARKSNNITQESYQTLDDASTLPDSEGRVTAVVAKVKYEATESQARRKSEHPGRHCTSDNIIKVLLDSGSDGDLMFHEKGAPMHFPYLTRQVPLSWHMSNGSYLTKGRSKVTLKFFNTQTVKNIPLPLTL